MKIFDLVQILIVFLLIASPPVLMAFLVRLRPINRLAQRSRSMRILVVLGNGLVYFVIAYSILLWLIAYLFLGLSELGIPVETTRAAVITEIWFRLFVTGGTQCFSGNPTTCQLADKAINMGVFAGNGSFALILVFITMLITLLLSWRFTSARNETSKTV